MSVPWRKTIDRGEIEKETERETLICFGCKILGYVRLEYPKLRKGFKKKKKEFMEIWNDGKESSSKDKLQKCANLCLMDHEDEVYSDSNFDPSLEELYDALNELMKEYKKLKRRSKKVNALNQNLSERFNTITKEKDCLAKKNQNLILENVELEKLNIDLINENNLLKKKSQNLKYELNKVKPFINKFTFSYQRLDLILKNQKAIFDRVELGFRSYAK